MFCSNCGTKIDPKSMYCPKCGQPVEDDDNTAGLDEQSGGPIRFSSDYGFDADQQKHSEGSGRPGDTFEDPYGDGFKSGSDASYNFTDFKSSVVDFTTKASGTASKAAEQAKAAAEQAKAAASKAKEKFNESIEKDVDREIQKANRKKMERAGLVNDRYSGAKYMSTSELWTWLKKDSKRQQFYTEDFSDETEAAYIEELRQMLDENGVPVTMEQREISWDRSNASEKLYIAVPKTKVVNPLTYIVQYSHVGKYTFVEEKTFITPPDLPPVPHDKIPYTGLQTGVIGYLLFTGLLCFIVPISTGIGGLWAVLLGLLCIGVAVYFINKKKKVDEYNKKCEEELKAWNDAWDNWRTSIFLHSFQEDVNGQLSRIFDSVFASINQINEVKFKGRKTLEEQDSSNLNELEQIISRKQLEYR